jgi:tetratricopeptide (TPR) repeat protein
MKVPVKSKKKEARKQEEAARRSSDWWMYAIGAAVALFVVFQIYAPALKGPFLFDDSYLPMNAPGLAEGRLYDWVAGVRPLLMFSYWANFRMAGTNTPQYHDWNVFLHFLNALLVYLILRKLLQFTAAPGALAVFGAALFLVHPAQTETVAYIAGRSDSLSTLFLLGAYALFLYRRSPAIGWPTAAGVLILFVAAMTTKENTVVLPALLLLTDYFWNPGFSFEGIRRNWRLYAPMALGAIAGVALVLRVIAEPEAPSAGFRMEDLAWYEYLFTQFRMFFRYLGIFAFPVAQTVDYDIPVSRSILDHGAIFGLLGILALAGAAVYFHRRYPLASFGFLLFAILLAPTSSFIPIRDPISERRLYLPMLGLLLVAIDLIRRARIPKGALVGALSAVVLAACVATYNRSAVWSGAIPLWEDAVKKSPGKSRAHFQLAFAYYSEGRCEEASRHYAAVARLEKPDYRLLVDWALADDCLNKPDEAMQKLEQAAALDKTAHVYTQMAMLHAKAGRFQPALQALAAAESIEPNFDVTYLYRGQLYASLNNLAAAEEQYKRALALNPRNPHTIDAMQRLQTHLRMRQ